MNRKHILLMIVCFMCSVLLCSCSVGDMFDKVFQSVDDRFSDIPYEHRLLNKRMDGIIDALQNKDSAVLKAVFSKNAIAQSENIDQSILDLFDYFQGDFVSYEGPKGMASTGVTNYGEQQKIYQTYYTVKTSTNEYRIAIKLYDVDSADPDNVGIHSLCMIRTADDIDAEHGYQPSEVAKAGIHIGVKTVLPKEYLGDGSWGSES